MYYFENIFIDSKSGIISDNGIFSLLAAEFAALASGRRLNGVQAGQGMAACCQKEQNGKPCCRLPPRPFLPGHASPACGCIMFISQADVTESGKSLL